MRMPKVLRPPELEEGDEGVLAEQGYKQELNRDWSLLHNFGVSFSIISVITGVSTLRTAGGPPSSICQATNLRAVQFGLTTGGPGVVSVGWIVVSTMTFVVAMGMAEIPSAHPTSGGPYFWSAMLAPREHAAFFSWVTGWFNFLGQGT